jgi:hypothetical protein
MTERRDKKASRVLEDLTSHTLTPEERAKREPKVPELRLRPDTPAIEISATSIADIVGRLRNEQLDILAIRDAQTDAVAVVLPIEQYLALAGKEIARRHNDWIISAGGRMPLESTLTDAHIEQINPSETWQG